MNSLKTRKIVVLNFVQEGAVSESVTHVQGFRFEVIEHRIGYNYAAGEALISHYDGYVDGICLSGIRKELAAGKLRLSHPGYLRLVRRSARSPIYVADDLSEVLTEWTLKRLLRTYPQYFLNRKILFHAAVTSHCLNPIAEAGGIIQSSDPLVIMGLPRLLKGLNQIEWFLRSIRPFHNVTFKLNQIKPLAHIESPEKAEFLNRAIENCDIFISFGRMLKAMSSYTALAGKTVFTDFVDDEVRAKLEAAGVDSIVEFIPRHPAFNITELKHFSVIAAIVDQIRVAEDDASLFADYLLNWFERVELVPNRVKRAMRVKRRCAFIIHPLAQNQLWQAPGLKAMKNAPTGMRRLIEKTAARMPIFLAGSVTGVKSSLTGEEVECDLFAMPATPRELLRMDPEFAYRRMIQATELARARGASMIGLGAYTKVIGDAGVTVSRRASLPVTNGNSYSASTTLWAAREMVEKMNLISPERDGKRLRAKAMIIGATGSIGRVSALLVATVFNQIVLVATRPDKLLELKDELQRIAPGVHVTVTTSANTDVADSDLIVTATSNQSGKLFDMELVKPGAVICDCSRPVDIGAEQAARRPDVLVIESGEVLLPGLPVVSLDLGLPQPSVYACLAETMLLTLEGRFEAFSLSKQLSMEKVKEIYRIGLRHGATLSAIRGPLGVVTDEVIAETRKRALERLITWNSPKISAAGLRKNLAAKTEEAFSLS